MPAQSNIMANMLIAICFAVPIAGVATATAQARQQPWDGEPKLVLVEEPAFTEAQESSLLQAFVDLDSGDPNLQRCALDELAQILPTDEAALTQLSRFGKGLNSEDQPFSNGLPDMDLRAQAVGILLTIATPLALRAALAVADYYLLTDDVDEATKTRLIHPPLHAVLLLPIFLRSLPPGEVKESYAIVASDLWLEIAANPRFSHAGPIGERFTVTNVLEWTLDSIRLNHPQGAPLDVDAILQDILNQPAENWMSISAERRQLRAAMDLVGSAVYAETQSEAQLEAMLHRLLQRWGDLHDEGDGSIGSAEDMIIEAANQLIARNPFLEFDDLKELFFAIGPSGRNIFGRIIIDRMGQLDADGTTRFLYVYLFYDRVVTDTTTYAISWLVESAKSDSERRQQIINGLNLLMQSPLDGNASEGFQVQVLHAIAAVGGDDAMKNLERFVLGIPANSASGQAQHWRDGVRQAAFQAWVKLDLELATGNSRMQDSMYDYVMQERGSRGRVTDHFTGAELQLTPAVVLGNSGGLIHLPLLMDMIEQELRTKSGQSGRDDSPIPSLAHAVVTIVRRHAVATGVIDDPSPTTSTAISLDRSTEVERVNLHYALDNAVQRLGTLVATHTHIDFEYMHARVANAQQQSQRAIADALNVLKLIRDELEASTSRDADDDF